jgi:hypothetical protein
VELGPSKVLTGMAKRTVATKFASQDKSLLIDRQFLSTSHDSKEIQYGYEQPSSELGATSQIEEYQDQAAASSLPIQSPPPGLEVSAISFPEKAATAGIADVPISALQIIQALVAQKIRKTCEQVPSSKSIKELTGGEIFLSCSYFRVKK